MMPPNYDARYAADVKQIALDEGATELAHRLFSENCPARSGLVIPRQHSEQCQQAAREIAKFTRIWAGLV